MKTSFKIEGVEEDMKNTRYLSIFMKISEYSSEIVQVLLTLYRKLDTRTDTDQINKIYWVWNQQQADTEANPNRLSQECP